MNTKYWWWKTSSRACTCKGLHTKHIPGLNNARERSHMRLFIPQASTRLSKNACLSDTCFVFVLLTSNLPRSFYSAEYKILTVVWQRYQRSPNYWIHSFFGTWLWLSQTAHIAHLTLPRCELGCLGGRRDTLKKETAPVVWYPLDSCQTFVLRKIKRSWN